VHRLVGVKRRGVEVGSLDQAQPDGSIRHVAITPRAGHWREPAVVNQCRGEVLQHLGDN
jgi:hypothetical protein